jgi:hypothetical protein
MCGKVIENINNFKLPEEDVNPDSPTPKTEESDTDLKITNTKGSPNNNSDLAETYDYTNTKNFVETLDTKLFLEGKQDSLEGYTKSEKVIRNVLTVSFVMLMLWSLYTTLIALTLPVTLGKIVGDISFIYQAANKYFYLIAIIGFLPIISLYNLVNIRNLSKKSLLIGLTTLGYVVLTNFTFKYALSDFFETMAKRAGETNRTIPEGNKSIIAYIGLAFFLIALTTLLLTLTKHNYHHKKPSRRSYIICTILATVFFVGYHGTITNAIVGFNEKPFIGHKKAQQNLGTKPIYFSYIPEGLSLEAAVSNSGEDAMLFLDFRNTSGVTDSNKALIISESLEEKERVGFTPETSNGLQYLVKASDKVTAIYFKKDKLNIQISNINNNYISKEELLKVANSAY